MTGFTDWSNNHIGTSHQSKGHMNSTSTKTKIIPLGFLLLALLMMSACQVIENPAQRSTATQVTIDTPVLTSVSTDLVASPETKTLMATQTMVPTKTPTPRWTVGVPLSRTQRATQMMKLWNSFETCPLPCWLGIVPGETRYEEALILADNLDIAPRYIKPTFQEAKLFKNGFSTVYMLEKSSMSMSSYYLSTQDEVDRMEINLGGGWYYGEDNLVNYLPSYSLESILKYYGEPDSVIIRAYVDTPAPNLGYAIGLIYEAEGFAVYYDGMTPKAETIQICLDDPSFPLTIIIVAQAQDFPAPLDKAIFLGAYINDYSIPLEEASGLSLAEFSDFALSDDPDACLEVPLAAFPEQ